MSILNIKNRIFTPNNCDDNLRRNLVIGDSGFIQTVIVSVTTISVCVVWLDVAEQFRVTLCSMQTLHDNVNEITSKTTYI